jgi:hypothetical protein
MNCKLFGSPKKPAIPLLSIPAATVLKEVRALSLPLMYPTLLDWGQAYYYTTMEGWGKVFQYIYFDFPMPSYIVGRMDCEDFALLLKGLVSAFFGLNYFAFVGGKAPCGPHGFNMLRDEGELHLWEPQPGFGIYEPFKIGDAHGYIPQYVLL